MRRVFTVIGTATTAICLVVGCGTSAPKPTYQKMTIREALKKVHFKVLQPTVFPFKVTNTFAVIGTLHTSDGTQTELFLTYQNKNEQQLLVEAVVNQNVPINSNGTDQQLKLADGEDAVYQDYKQLGVLYWWPNSQSYALQDKSGVPTSNNTKPFLTPAQLVAIANSVK